MGFGRRTLWLCFAMAATAVGAPAAEPGGVVRLTVDIAWKHPSAGPVRLAVPGGRVVEAQPRAADSPAPAAVEGGAWRLGEAAEGAARVRVEGPVGASLRVSAAGAEHDFAIVDLLDGPRRGGGVVVERLAWDSIEVAAGGDGTAMPGGSWPLAVGFNVLTPEPGEVTLRFEATLRPIRGGEPAWRSSRAEVVATDAIKPASLPLDVPAPAVEGTYVLELQTIWEPVEGRDGTRLKRWLRRRRDPAPVVTTRRLTLAVVAPGSASAAPNGRAEAVVDALDPARPHRSTVAGRAPTAADGSWPIPEPALGGAHLGDRLIGRLARAGGESLLPADASGVAFTSWTLKVPRPGRPHRLQVAVAEGRPADLAVGLVAAGSPPKVLLDARAAGEPVGRGSKPSTSAFLAWPDSSDIVLILANRGERPLMLGAVELVELPADPAPLALAEGRPEPARQLALDLTGPGAVGRFGEDPVGRARAMGAYLNHVGIGAVILPEARGDRDRRGSLNGQAVEDGTGPDTSDLLLDVLGRRGIAAVVEARVEGPLPGLPGPETAEALAKGLARAERAGPAYQPLRPEVRRAIRARLAEAASARRGHPNVEGVLVRLGPGWSLPGSPEIVPDDATYDRFVRSAFKPEDAATRPGLGTADPKRLDARRQFLAGPGELAWRSWRAREVGSMYADLQRHLALDVPGARLIVATPGLDDGPAGDEARRHDKAGLPLNQAWRAVGLDLRDWPVGGPAVWRGVAPAAEGLAREVALDPGLDAQVAARAGRGLILGEDRRASGVALRASAPSLEEPLGHALAVLDARWVALPPGQVAGREEQVRRYARVLRALPDAAEPRAPAPRGDSGVAARSWTVGGTSYLALSNDTPYTLHLDSNLDVPAGVVVEDLGRGLRLTPAAAPGGGRRLVVRLDPFAAAAIRVGRPDVRPGQPTPHFLDGPAPEAAALTTLLGRSTPPGGPANAGFEPEEPRGEVDPVAHAPAAALGWSAESGTIEADADNPHAGRSSLRLSARSVAVGEWFTPAGGSPLALEVWVRGEGPTRLRLHVEALSDGQPISRRAEVDAPAAWRKVSLPLADLPAGGLDRARVRVESLGEGRAWVDDLSLTGQAPAEADRRGQRAVAAALRAYQDGRYADFARLAAAGRLPAEPAPVRAVGATDLPAGRRLR